MSNPIKKVVSQVTETLGLAPDTSGQERAARAMAAAQEAAKNLQANMAVDLSTPGTASVSTGASANTFNADDTKKRRRSGTTVASNLGIDV